MNDDKTKTSTPERNFVNINEDCEVKYWATTLGVSAEELVDAVNKVGIEPLKVEAYLKNPEP